MLLYISLFIIILLPAIYEIKAFPKKLDGKIYYFVILILSLLCGLRIYGGSDFLIYKEYFEGTRTLSHIEFGFTAIINLFRSLGLGYRAYLLTVSILFHFLFLVLCRRYFRYPFLSFLFFFSMNYFWDFYILQRQIISIMLFLFSLPALINRKMWTYFLFCIFALLFHSSSVILFPLYFVAGHRFTLNKMLYILIGFILFVILFNLIETPFLNMMTNLNLGKSIVSNYFAYKAPINILMYIESFFFLSIFVVFRSNYATKLGEETYFNLFLNIVFYRFLLFLVALTVFGGIVNRFTLFFDFAYAGLLSISWVILKRGMNQSLVLLALFSYFFIRYIRFLIVFDSGAFLNLKNIFVIFN